MRRKFVQLSGRTSQIRFVFHLIVAVTLTVLAKNSFAQNGTKDLVYSKRVKQFIVISPDFSGKKVNFTVDNDPGIKVNLPLASSRTLGMRPSSDNLIILTPFFNPFRNRAVLTDSSYADENFASLQKFYDAAKIMIDVLAPTNTTGTGISTASASGIQMTTSAAEFDGKPDNLVSPFLTDWKFLYFSEHIDQCQPSFSKIVTSLGQVDIAYYGTGQDSFQKAITGTLRKLSSANNFKELTTAKTNLSNTIAKLNDSTTKYTSYLGELKGAAKAFEAHNNTTDPNNVIQCELFLQYTQKKIDDIVADVNKKQAVRKTIIESLESMEKELEDFFKNTNEATALAKSETELVRIGTYPIEEENGHQVSVIFKEREVAFKDDKITLTDKATITSNKLYLRAVHFLIPEFSTGIFHTNLSYQMYDTKQVADSFTIVDGGTEKYPFVLAAHLNLIVNAYQGPVLPMLQVGVGTAKDRPSLLGGVGIRFLKPKNLAISYGRLWTWKKEFNKLQINQKIGTKADLENDLQWKLQSNSNHYIGLQYNF